MLKLFVCFIALVSWLGAVETAQAYELGPEDKVRIRLVEWSAARATATNWDVVAGEYVVGADGSVVLPLLGAVAVAGLTLEEFGAFVSRELESRYGLSRILNASVEVIEYRPVYILGAVSNPGAFPYRPGLTVLQGISLAGGLYRGGDVAIQMERDAITSGGELEVLRLQRARLLAREARLRTELKQEASVEMTDELTAGGVDEALLGDENALLEARTQNLTSQTEAIARLNELLEGEIEALQQKIASENRLLDLSRDELESIGNLVDRGLVVNSRQREMLRIVAETENRLIDLQTLTLRARQEISRAQRELLKIETQHQADIVRELQETQAQLNENAVRQSTAADVLEQVAAIAPGIGGPTMNNERSLSFQIIRPGCEDGLQASPQTSLNPGDTLQISREDVFPVIAGREAIAGGSGCAAETQ